MVPVSGIHTNISDCAHANLIEDLLNEAFQYVISARLQSDPVEDIFPSTGEWMAVGFLSVCEKSKTPRECCNTVLYVKKILIFGKRILQLGVCYCNWGHRTREIVESVLDENSVEVITWYVAKKFIKRSRCENCKILLKAEDNDIAHDA